MRIEGITKKELAEMLNGCEYGYETTRREQALAEANGLVIVCGYSDDCMEFFGALREEVYCFDGGTAYVTKSAVFQMDDKDDAPEEAREIRAIWCAPDSPPWTYETDIHHETFSVYEDGEVFCVGIVFGLEDL